MEQKLKYLVDRSEPFNEQRVKLLDQLSISLSQNTPQGKEAQTIWNLLKEDDYFWFNSDKIMLWSNVDQTKIFTLIILEYAIKQKWYVLTSQQRESLKNYMVGLILNLGAKENISKTQQNILSKSNSVLVQIIKYEWNSTWKTFLPDICQASYSNPVVCQNNLYILKMLSEQIFDYSRNQMTTKQIAQLKQKMANDFLVVFQLCQDILNSVAQAKQSLIQSCLETLLAFLSWIPMYYIIYSDLIDRLIFIIPSDYLRGYTMSCLIEIAGLKVETNNKEEVNKFLFMLKNATVEFLKIVPLYTNRNDIKKYKSTLRKKWMHFQTLARNISMFYCEFFKQQDSWLSNAVDGNQQMIQACRTGFNYLLMFMRIDDDQVFKICIQFFHFYIGKYLEKLSQNQFQNPNFGSFEHKTLQSVYKEIFMEVMKIISFKMAKPEQVLIVIDEDGVPYREQAKNTENSSLYEVMKELASFLVKVDWPEMKKFIISQIEAQQNNDQFSFDALNSLSWMVGSLCGSMVQKQQKNFFITSLRTLLHLCENKKGKQNKAVIASCIMYVVGQYPTFLRNNWTFLRTVVKKLFQFMKQQFPGIMDMACNAFLKIVKTTADQFVVVQLNDKQPFIREIIRKIPEETQKLTSDPLKFVFYEAVGYLIGAEKDSQTQIELIRQTLGYSLYEFQNIVTASQANRQILLQQQVKLKILFFLKLNETLATGVGQMYALYLLTINNQINSAYMFYSQQVKIMFEKGGKNVLSYLTMKQMRAIKRQAIRIYIRYLQKCDNLTNQQSKYILDSFVIPLGMPLIDFQNTPAEIKQHQFVSLFAVILSKLHAVITSDFFATVVDVIFNSTLPLITADFNSYPEIRENFFAFLKALIKYNFGLLYSLDQDKFQLILNCVIWSFRHELSTFTDLGLELLQDILTNVNSNQQTMNVFYPKYIAKISTQILDVMTDGFHKSGLETQTKIFYLLIQVTTSNIITSRISLNQPEGQSNAEYLYFLLVDKLIAGFPHTAKDVTEDRVKKWFLQNDEQLFKDQIADYLVLINRYTPAEITQSKKEPVNHA